MSETANLSGGRGERGRGKGSMQERNASQEGRAGGKGANNSALMERLLGKPFFIRFWLLADPYSA